jgi:hypothetical protein
VGHAADRADAIARGELGAQRPVADRDERRVRDPEDGVAQPHDVLALVHPADVDDHLAGQVAEPEMAAGRLLRTRREAQEVDAAVDDLRLRPRLGQHAVQLVAQPARHGDDGRRAADGGARRDADRRVLGDVAHVAAVRGQHERHPRGRRGGRRDDAGGEEVVRVHDVGTTAQCVTQGVDGQAALLARRAGAVVDDRRQDRVPHRLQALGDLLDEHAVVRILRPRPHGGDEQDAHQAAVTGVGPSARIQTARRSSLPG